MNDLKDQIEAAREKVAYCRIKAERPSARLEDEFALEKARNRLLTLELRLLKLGGERPETGSKAAGGRGRARTDCLHEKRTKHEQVPRTARERAEAAFASLQGGVRAKTLGLGERGGD